MKTMNYQISEITDQFEFRSIWRKKRSNIAHWRLAEDRPNWLIVPWRMRQSTRMPRVPTTSFSVEDAKTRVRGSP